MNTSEHIQEIAQISSDWIRKDCANLMFELECFELPVLSESKVIGRVLLEDCLIDSHKTIADVVENTSSKVYINTHLFDVMQIFRSSNAAVCAVVDLEGNFLGIITKEMVLNRLSHSISTEQPGAILLIEMATHQYSSSEISQIVEGENAQILSMWLEQVPDSGRIRLSMKVNTNSAERIVSSLQRFNYEVISSFGDDDYKDTVERRYQAFIKYLDL
ncbi:MAG: CBS domain-containing protein [Bacteroidia bacterium]